METAYHFIGCDCEECSPTNFTVDGSRKPNLGALRLRLLRQEQETRGCNMIHSDRNGREIEAVLYSIKARFRARASLFNTKEFEIVCCAWEFLANRRRAPETWPSLMLVAVFSQFRNASRDTAVLVWPPYPNEDP